MKKYELFCAELLKAQNEKKRAEAVLLEDLTSATWRKNRFTEAVIAAETYNAMKELADNTKEFEKLSDARIDELLLEQCDKYKAKRDGIFFIYTDAEDAKRMYEAFGRIAAIFRNIAYAN